MYLSSATAPNVEPLQMILTRINRKKKKSHPSFSPPATYLTYHFLSSFLHIAGAVEMTGVAVVDGGGRRVQVEVFLCMCVWGGGNAWSAEGGGLGLHDDGSAKTASDHRHH